MEKSSQIYNSLSNSTRGNVLMLLLCGLFGLIFYYLLFCGPLGISFELDSVRTVISQFKQFWINGDTADRFQYFIKKSIGIHPKIMIRIFCLLSYYSTGFINLSVLDILSNLGLPITLITIYYHFLRGKAFFLVPIAAILFTITFKNYWLMASVGLAYSLLLNLLLFVLVYRKKYVWAIPIMFILVFRSGAGYLVFIPLYIGLVYLLIKRKISWLSTALVICSSIVFYLLFQSLSASADLIPEARIQNENSILNFDRLFSMGIYFAQGLGSFWTSDHFFNTHKPALDTTFGFAGIILFIFFLFKSNLEDWKNLSLLSTACYYLGLCAAAALMNDNAEKLLEAIPNRYVVFSLFFWICIWLLFVTNYSNKKSFKYAGLILFILTIISFSYNSISIYPKLKKKKSRSLEAIINSLSGDYLSNPGIALNETRNIITHKIYKDGQDLNFVNPVNLKEGLSQKFNPEELIIRKKVKESSPILKYTIFSDKHSKLNFYSDREMEFVIVKKKDEYYRSNKPRYNPNKRQYVYHLYFDEEIDFKEDISDIYMPFQVNLLKLEARPDKTAHYNHFNLLDDFGENYKNRAIKIYDDYYQGIKNEISQKENKRFYFNFRKLKKDRDDALKLINNK